MGLGINPNLSVLPSILRKWFAKSNQNLESEKLMKKNKRRCKKLEQKIKS